MIDYVSGYTIVHIISTASGGAWGSSALRLHDWPFPLPFPSTSLLHTLFGDLHTTPQSTNVSLREGKLMKQWRQPRHFTNQIVWTLSPPSPLDFRDRSLPCGQLSPLTLLFFWCQGHSVWGVPGFVHFFLLSPNGNASFV